MEDTRQIIQDSSVAQRLEAFDNFCEEIYNKKCVNCKKSIKSYNYMKHFKGYFCKDKLFKDNIDPFPKGFGCTKFKIK